MKILAKIISFIPSSIKLKLYKSRFGSIFFLIKNFLFYIASKLGKKVVINTKTGPFYIDLTTYPHSQTIMGNYEIIMQSAFDNNLKQEDVFYDIGANIGFHTLYCANIVGQNGLVYSFEPNIKNIEKLKKNCALNPEFKIVIIDYAISDVDGDSLFDFNKGSEEGRLSNQGDYIVEVRKIDTLLENKEILPPDVIKLDIEGEEENALKGALNTIKKYKPVIICDYNDETTFPVVKEFLKPLGYEIESKNIIIARPTKNNK